jgi:predicted RNA-binding protein
LDSSEKYARSEDRGRFASTVSEVDKMCDSHVYLMKKNGEELLMENVQTMRPEGEEIYLEDLFGQIKRIRAKVKEMNLIEHRIVLSQN